MPFHQHFNTTCKHRKCIDALFFGDLRDFKYGLHAFALFMTNFYPWVGCYLTLESRAPLSQSLLPYLPLGNKSGIGDLSNCQSS